MERVKEGEVGGTPEFVELGIGAHVAAVLIFEVNGVEDLVWNETHELHLVVDLRAVASLAHALLI